VQQTQNGPVAGYDPVIGRVDRRNKKQKTIQKSMFRCFEMPRKAID